VLENLEAVSGVPAGDVVEDQLRFPLAVRLPDGYRDTPEAIAALTVLAPTGERIPLSRLADIREVRGPKLISSEWGKRRITTRSARIPGQVARAASLFYSLSRGSVPGVARVAPAMALPVRRRV